MLEGILVAEFGRVFSAPLAGMILSDMGAQVIKIERKGVGDESRQYGANIGEGVTDYFYALNRNKEILQLDLKNEDDLREAKKILARADVLIHNSLQASFDTLGLSYEAVQGINPRIIYAAISGYGANSKYKNSPSQDLTIQGLSGFMSLTGNPGEAPLKTGIPVVDFVTGQYLVTGILAALLEREKTGKGRLVTASLLESAVSMTMIEAVRYLNTGLVAGRSGNRHHSIAPYNSFKTGDGYVLIAVANDEMFQRFAGALEIADSGFETNGQRLANIDALESIINEKTSKYSSAGLVSLLKSNKISCAPVNDIALALGSEEVQELNIIKEGGPGGKYGRLKYIDTPLKFLSV